MTELQKLVKQHPEFSALWVNNHELIDKHIKACHKLLLHYRREKFSLNCPLCDITDTCDDCVWLLMTGLNCSEKYTNFVGELFSTKRPIVAIDEIRNYFSEPFKNKFLKDKVEVIRDKWFKMRQAMLETWITVLQEHLEFLKAQTEENQND